MPVSVNSRPVNTYQQIFDVQTTPQAARFQKSTCGFTATRLSHYNILEGPPKKFGQDPSRFGVPQAR